MKAWKSRSKSVARRVARVTWASPSTRRRIASPSLEESAAAVFRRRVFIANARVARDEAEGQWPRASSKAVLSKAQRHFALISTEENLSNGLGLDRALE